MRRVIERAALQIEILGLFETAHQVVGRSGDPGLLDLLIGNTWTYHPLVHGRCHSLDPAEITPQG